MMALAYAQGHIGESALIQGASSDCHACWGCVRACAARAIRVVGGYAEVIEDRCVKCGACVAACGTGGMVVRDDTSRVMDLLAGPRSVVALLATESVAAMRPLSPSEVDDACRELGFMTVESTLLGEEIVAREYEDVRASRADQPVVRSTCPVVTEWIRRFRPGLVGMLAPVVPPYIAQARLVRSMYEEQVAIVYVSPCYARKDEILEPEFEGIVDVAIGFDELRRLFTSGPLAAARTSKGSSADPVRLRVEKDISLTDGFPRSFLDGKVGGVGGLTTVRGLDRLDRLAEAIEAGEAAPGIVDALYCESCIDGPAMGVDLSGYARRVASATARRPSARVTVASRDLLRHLPDAETSRRFGARVVEHSAFTEARIDESLAEGGFAGREQALDCGACGYATCVEHAVAVLSGASEWEACLPIHVKRLESKVADLQDHATIDPLTGLWNRRVFYERLANEFARFRRYGLPLALLMVDLDGFKTINDTYGHRTGDAVLCQTASAMKAVLRETDIAARYGGDEFALILPGVDKTAGYAVAEKLRAAISQLEVPVASSDAEESITGTISVGLASAQPTMGSHDELLEQADRALYRAKEQGRDRVRLAPD